MVTFRKKLPVEDLVPKALDYLKEQGVAVEKISEKDAESVSKVNSKAMVLVSFTKTETGAYQIQLRDKELYNYTQKLVKDVFKMRIKEVDKDTRTITAETDHLGVALDIIEVLAIKYKLSIVTKKL